MTLEFNRLTKINFDEEWVKCRKTLQLKKSRKCTWFKREKQKRKQKNQMFDLSYFIIDKSYFDDAES